MSTTAGSPSALRHRPAYRALEAHHERIGDAHLRDLFADDPARGTRLTAEAEGLFLDYSKNRVTDETLRLLVELAEQSGLRERIDAMFAGEHIKITEVHAVLERMARFADAVRSGEWKGHTGRRIRNVVNIGIGGSDLGPVMAYE